MTKAVFDIRSFVDEQRIGSLHYRVLALCLAVMFIDGFDIFVVGKVAPAIAQDFGVTPAAMTVVFVLQQTGLALGAFLISPLADYLGRKRMLVITSLAFGLLTILTANSTSVTMFAILRGFSGLFLACVLPIAVALLSEFTPRKRRATFLAVAMAGFSIGNAAGATMALLVPDFGWEIAFWIGGLVPLLLLPLMMMYLPESLSFRAMRDPCDPEIARMIKRIAPEKELTGEERFISNSKDRPETKSNVLDVFRDGRVMASIVLFTACTLSMGNIALIAAWLPSFFQQMAGISIQRFAIAAMIGFLGGTAGMLTIGFLMDRMRPARLLPSFFLGLCGALVLLGQVPFDTILFIPTLFAVSFFQAGGQAGLNMLMTQVYPTAVRSTGVGWAGGAGRIGGIVLPLFGGLALAGSFSLELTLALVAVPPCLVAVLLLLLPKISKSADT